MISNYSLSCTREKLEKETGINSSRNDYKPSYNICPRSYSFIICQDKPSAFIKALWGLVPHWSKQKSASANLYNAEIQGISSKTSFRIPIRSKRCIIPCDSYYVFDNKRKAYRILHKEKKLIFLAGVYDDWSDKNKKIRSYSMLTRRFTDQKIRIPGNYTPIILDDGEMKLWLSYDTPLKEILLLINQNNNDKFLRYYQISDKIKDTNFNTADIHEEEKEELTLFS